MHFKKLLPVLAILLLSFRGYSQTCNPNSPRTYTSSGSQRIADRSNFVISNVRIANPSTNSGWGIQLTRCSNVIIENCIIGPTALYGIELVNSTNVTIRNCIFESNYTGVHANGGSGLKVLNNQFSNPQGPFPRGQYVQFENVIGAGTQINYNSGECIMGASYPEDLINLLNCHGTTTSPIEVYGNKFRGGGPSESGGGIMTGDNGGSNVIVKDNILVDPGQYGIAIASGTNIQILNNKVFGRQQSFTNVGIYVWNQYSTPCGNNRVEGNTVKFTNYNGISNPHWSEGNCGPVAGYSNNLWDHPIDATILPERILCPYIALRYNFQNNYSDVSGGGMHAANYGTGLVPVSYIQASPNVYASFDGIDDYISLSNTYPIKPTALQKITVSAWIRPNVLSTTRGIVHSPNANGWDDGWRMVLAGAYFSPRVVTENGAQDLYCDGLTAGKWNHVAFTYDGIRLRGYVNGVLKGSVNLTGRVIYNHNYPMELGWVAGNDNYFSGGMDEFTIYRGALTSDEILTNYQNAYVNYPGARKRSAQGNYPEETATRPQVQPNPTTGKVQFVISEADHITKLTVTNIMGKVLLVRTLNKLERVGSLDLENYPSGVYIIGFENERGEVHTSKIMLRK